jgi:hypothetical protein
MHALLYDCDGEDGWGGELSINIIIMDRHGAHV